MPTCSAFGCSKSTSGKNKDTTVSFHQYPLKDKALLAVWQNKTKRGDADKKGTPWTATKHSVLCSDHFEKNSFFDDLYHTYVGRSPGKKPVKKLKPGSIPTIFPHKAETKPRSHTEKRLERQARQEVSTVDKMVLVHVALKGCL